MASQQIEMGMVPLKWEADIRCTEFWHRVMTMGEKCLVKKATKEALLMDKMRSLVAGLLKKRERGDWHPVCHTYDVL